MSAEIQRVTEVPKILPRRRSGHKGEYGRTLIVGGSRGMMGAVALAGSRRLSRAATADEGMPSQRKIPTHGEKTEHAERVCVRAISATTSRKRLPNDRDYCQTHGCKRPCKVEVKLAALDKYRKFGE